VKLKALFLAIVFASPLVLLLVPADIYQYVWMPLYVPVGVILALIAYQRPRREMFAWIVVTPILFWLVMVMVLPFFLMGTPSVGAWGQTTLAIMVVAMPVGFLVGAYVFLLAILLFAVFRSRGWLT
jgi:hypothetical protein